MSHIRRKHGYQPVFDLQNLNLIHISAMAGRCPSNVKPTKACSRIGVIMSKIISFLRDESGASAAEYALILAIVGIGIVVAAGSLRDAIGGAMNRAANTINTAS